MAVVNAGFGSISPVASGGDAHVFDTATAYTAGNIASFQTNAAEKASVDFEGTFTGHDGIFGGKVTVAETLAVTGASTLTAKVTVGLGAAGIAIGGSRTGANYRSDIEFLTTDAASANKTWGIGSNIWATGAQCEIYHGGGAALTISLAGLVSVPGTLTSTGLITATAGVKLGTTVTLTEGAANRLDLASGDSFNIVSGGLGVGVVNTTAGTLQTSGIITVGGDVHMMSDSAIQFGDSGTRIIGNSTSDFLRFDTGGAERMRLTDTGLTVSGTGPHAIGGALQNWVQLRIAGSFTSGGGSTVAYGTRLSTALTGATGDTVALANVLIDNQGITTQGATETIIDVASIIIFEPAITVGIGDTITNATTVKIVSAPTEGTNNYALWVDAGDTRLDGALLFNSQSVANIRGATAFTQFTNAAGTVANLIVSEAGLVGIRESINTNMTVGLTINQGSADNEILAFKSSDLAHGMTSQTETDTYGFIRKATGLGGGLQLTGLTDTDGAGGEAVMIRGMLGEAADTTKTTSATGIIKLQTFIKSGTTVVTPGADGNLLVITAASTARFIFDAEGSAHADVEWIAFDAHNDLAVLEDFETLMAPGTVQRIFGEAVTHDRAFFEQQGLIHDIRSEGESTRGMVNFSRLAMLNTGALRQVGSRQMALESCLRTLLLENSSLVGRDEALALLN